MKQLSTHAHAAKLIRQELKAAFPGIKFSVTSESYSGGSSIRTEWVNGPTENQVNAIIQKYQYGHFDGMYDIYEHSNSRDDIPQVKFVFASRSITDDVIQSCFDLHFKSFTMFEGISDINEQVYENGWRSIRSESRRVLSKLDLRQPLTEQRLWEAR